MTAWQPGMNVTADRLMDGIDASVVASGFVPATGWAVADFNVATSGHVVEWNLYATLTGATLAVVGAGNLNDTFVGTSPVGARPARGTITGFWDNGTACGGFVMGTDGVVTLRTTNGEPVTSGTNLRMHLTFIV